VSSEVGESISSAAEGAEPGHGAGHGGSGGARPGRAAALRLVVATEDAARLRRHPLLSALAAAPSARLALRHAYFDTPDLALGRAGLALRLRRAGRQRVQTLEVAGSGARPPVELDSLVGAEAPDPERIPDLALRERVAGLVRGASLERVFEVELARTRRMLREGANVLRFDLDVGEIRGAWGSTPICDLELAPRDGDPGHPFQLALKLLESAQLRPSARSLAERGYERAAGRGAAAHRAQAPVAAADATVDALLAAVVEPGLRHLVANEPAAQEGVDPEGVHQMRVAARRMRSALAFFATVVPERQREPLRSELRWLAGELGPARDLDVFTAELLGPLVAARPEDAELAQLLAAAQTLRAESQVRVRDALRSSRYPRLAFQLGAWLARRAWREQPLSEAAALLFAPARPWSAARLERRHRKARKAGRGLAEATAAERHLLRIRLKKLRYAAEFAGALYPGRRAERYARRLARLQDALGHLNDVALAEHRLEELVAGPGPPELAGEASRAAGFARGWLAHSARVELEGLPERWRRFEAAGRFWSRDLA
jgi:inorganic triphosphatase YgiF